MEPSIPFSFSKYTARGVELVQGSVIGETRWALYANRALLVSFMCTPRYLHHLALGFCLSEGLIDSLADVQLLRVYESTECCYLFVPALGLNGQLTLRVCPASVGVIDIRIVGSVPPNPVRVLTSGCGGGITFDDLSSAQAPLDSTLRVTAAEIFALMRELNTRALLYRASRGVHTSLLATAAGKIVLAEDVGRHNTLDKIRGECLLRGLPTQEGILLTSGRISSEMMAKAAKMGVPLVVSRTSPTALSTRLAHEWNITTVGYARGSEMNVYTHAERILPVGEAIPLGRPAWAPGVPSRPASMP